MTAHISGHVPAEAVVPPERRPLAACFRALVALAAIAGILIDLFIGDPLRVLSYFTIQSNLIVAVVFTLSAWRAWKGLPPLPAWVTTGTVLFITITGLVYHVVLANASSGFSMTNDIASQAGWHTASNNLLHTVTPLAAVADWFLLTAGLKKRAALKFPKESAKGIGFYAVRRTMQMRRWRLPKPMVKRGEKPY